MPAMEANIVEFNSPTGSLRGFCKTKNSIIIINNNHISITRAEVIVLLGVLIGIILMFFVGIKIAHSVVNLETRYDPQTLKWRVNNFNN